MKEKRGCNEGEIKVKVQKKKGMIKVRMKKVNKADISGGNTNERKKNQSKK